MTDQLYKQNTRRPTRKVEAAALGAILATVGMGGLAAASPEVYAAINAHAGFETALGGLFATGLAYFTRERL